MKQLILATLAALALAIVCCDGGVDTLQVTCLMEPAPAGLADAELVVKVWAYDPDVADESATLVAEHTAAMLDAEQVARFSVPADPGLNHYVSVDVDVDGDGTIEHGDYVQHDMSPKVLTGGHPTSVTVVVAPWVD